MKSVVKIKAKNEERVEDIYSIYYKLIVRGSEIVIWQMLLTVSKYDFVFFDKFYYPFHSSKKEEHAHKKLREHYSVLTSDSVNTRHFDNSNQT